MLEKKNCHTSNFLSIKKKEKPKLFQNFLGDKINMRGNHWRETRGKKGPNFSNCKLFSLFLFFNVFPF